MIRNDNDNNRKIMILIIMIYNNDTSIITITSIIRNGNDDSGAVGHRCDRSPNGTQC